MRRVPSIGEVGENEDFHDSSLIAFDYSPLRETLTVVLSSPNEFDVQELWQIQLRGVLALDFETLGDGEPVGSIPPEIYDVYEDRKGSAAIRWENRLRVLGHSHPSVHVITFASSYLRGWGANSEVEGIQVVCRQVEVSAASAAYSGQEYSRPRIDSEE